VAGYSNSWREAEQPHASLVVAFVLSLALASPAMPGGGSLVAGVEQRAAHAV
jgi:hypothetical protein